MRSEQQRLHPDPHPALSGRRRVLLCPGPTPFTERPARLCWYGWDRYRARGRQVCFAGSGTAHSAKVGLPVLSATRPAATTARCSISSSPNSRWPAATGATPASCAASTAPSSSSSTISIDPLDASARRDLYEILEERYGRDAGSGGTQSGIRGKPPRDCRNRAGGAVLGHHLGLALAARCGRTLWSGITAADFSHQRGRSATQGEIGFCLLAAVSTRTSRPHRSGPPR